MVIEKFKKLLRMDEPTVKLLVAKFLLKNGYTPEYADGYVYAKGDIPVLLVAHMDTVHKTKPKQIYYDSEEDIMWSPQGIGGDDRCGVFAIFEILKTHRPHVLFTEDEEIGCIGARKAADKLKPDVNFIIELDRRGVNDCVFYDCGNADFQKYIESFGFHKEIGSYSDIVELSEKWGVASVNLSIGYENEHSSLETISPSFMELTKDKVIKILDDANTNRKLYDYEPLIYDYKYYGTGKYDGYDDYDWYEEQYKKESEEKEGKK